MGDCACVKRVGEQAGRRRLFLQLCIGDDDDDDDIVSSAALERTVRRGDIINPLAVVIITVRLQSRTVQLRCDPYKLPAF